MTAKIFIVDASESFCDFELITCELEVFVTPGVFLAP